MQVDSFYVAGRLTILHKVLKRQVLRVENTSTYCSWRNVKEIIVNGTQPALSGGVCHRGF